MTVSRRNSRPNLSYIFSQFFFMKCLRQEPGSRYISNLVAAGVNPKVAQDLARHSTVTLTLGRYAHVQLHDKNAAISNLPALMKPTPRSTPQTEVLQATGTDGDAARRCTPRCTSVAKTADGGRDGLTLVDSTGETRSSGTVPDCERSLRASDTERARRNK